MIDRYQAALDDRSSQGACLDFATRFLAAPAEERATVREAWDHSLRWAMPDPFRLACMNEGPGTPLERMQTCLLFDGLAFGAEGDRESIRAFLPSSTTAAALPGSTPTRFSRRWQQPSASPAQRPCERLPRGRRRISPSRPSCSPPWKILEGASRCVRHGSFAAGDPMPSVHVEARTVEEVSRAAARLARVIGARSADLPTVGLSEQNGRPHLEYAGSHFVLIVYERGTEVDRESTDDVNLLLYWIFKNAAFRLASAAEWAPIAA